MTTAEEPKSESQVADVVEEHPEVLVGAAFIGGFALAQILKRLGS